jgi:hypothetical protein
MDNVQKPIIFSIYNYHNISDILENVNYSYCVRTECLLEEQKERSEKHITSDLVTILKPFFVTRTRN